LIFLTNSLHFLVTTQPQTLTWIPDSRSWYDWSIGCNILYCQVVAAVLWF